MPVTADTIINTVRDQIPDPVYDATGNALPATDGNLFRTQTLLRWISQAVKVTAQKCGWLVEDWTSAPVRRYQPFYALDTKWQGVREVWLNEWRLGYLEEAEQVFPAQVRGNQPVWWGLHRQTDHLEVALLPVPDFNDPATTITTTLNQNEITTFVVGSTTSFNDFGFLTVGTEQVQYQSLVGTTSIQVLTRGVAGTSVGTHNALAPVTHNGLWIKGVRVPNDITSISGNTGVIELPAAFIHPVELYVLAKCRESENEHEEARALMRDYNQEVALLRADPSWRRHQGSQIQAYGDPRYGPLAYGRIIVS